MTKRAWYISGVLAFCTTVGILAFCLRPTEPQINGKKLSDLIDELRPKKPDGSKDFWQRNARRREEAQRSIQSTGATAVPALHRMLRYHAGVFTKQIFPALSKVKLLKFNQMISRAEAREYFQNWNGIAGASALGPAAAPLSEDLARYLTDKNWTHRVNSADALGNIGPGARRVVPQMLATAAKSGDVEFRKKILLAVTAIGADPTSANPVLTNFLADVNGRTRAAAMICFVAINSNAAPVVPFLVGQLRDGDVYVRSSALNQLTRLGTNASTALPAVINLLQDGDPSVRRLAASCKSAISATSMTAGATNSERPTMEFNFSGVLISVMLSEYQDLRGQPVQYQRNLGAAKLFRVQTAVPVTRTEAIWLLEDALRTQGNIIIVTNADGTLYAKESGQRR